MSLTGTHDQYYNQGDNTEVLYYDDEMEPEGTYMTGYDVMGDEYEYENDEPHYIDDDSYDDFEETMQKTHINGDVKGQLEKTVTVEFVASPYEMANGKGTVWKMNSSAINSLKRAQLVAGKVERTGNPKKVVITDIRPIWASNPHGFSVDIDIPLLQHNSVTATGSSVMTLPTGYEGTPQDKIMDPVKIFTQDMYVLSALTDNIDHQIIPDPDPTAIMWTIKTNTFAFDLLEDMIEEGKFPGLGSFRAEEGVEKYDLEREVLEQVRDLALQIQKKVKEATVDFNDFVVKLSRSDGQSFDSIKGMVGVSSNHALAGNDEAQRIVAEARSVCVKFAIKYVHLK